MRAPSSPKAQRCAIYTRKSTDHNLDLTFNSLDAQREACEAYIKSQAHEGWSLVPDRFDDGAFSGASLDRPALQALLDIVRLKKVDIIVVYKVDRLTRSLADFAKLVELFDEHGVSFVSVTQSFNTTSSMGRLTLNVLLSFAQFEREVIGERVRDKIAASKRKGIWVGGPVPLGYRSVNKKLEVVPVEAALVRRIYEDYLRLGSIRQLVLALNTEGIKPKPRPLANGSSIAAEFFRVGPIAHLLKNRFYIGEVEYNGEINPGEHPPILERELFDAVQARMAQSTVERMQARSTSPALLTGLIFDDRGNLMSPSHSNKNGIRYRYYVSQALLQNRKGRIGSVRRISAPEIEQRVIDLIKEGGARDLPINRNLIQGTIRRVTILSDRIDVDMLQDRHEDVSSAWQSDLGPETTGRSTLDYAVPQPLRKGIAFAPGQQGSIDPQTREVLLKAIARARRWIDDILAGNVQSFEQIAQAEDMAERYVRRLSVLAYLAPKVVAAIANGSAPAALTVSALTQSLSHSWADQERSIGLNASWSNPRF